MEASFGANGSVYYGGGQRVQTGDPGVDDWNRGSFGCESFGCGLY